MTYFVGLKLLKKKILLIVCTILVLAILILIFVNKNEKYEEAINNEISFEQRYCQEDFTFLRYQDIFVTLLLPYIKDSISNYYGKSYSVSPDYINVKDVKRINGFRTFNFLIELEILPYKGQYEIIGVDRITFKISEDAKVEVENYKHIRDYSR